jgi:hypothetical protein
VAGFDGNYGFVVFRYKLLKSGDMNFDGALDIYDELKEYR